MVTIKKSINDARRSSISTKSKKTMKEKELVGDPIYGYFQHIYTLYLASLMSEAFMLGENVLFSSKLDLLLHNISK